MSAFLPALAWVTVGTLVFVLAEIWYRRRAAKRRREREALR